MAANIKKKSWKETVEYRVNSMAVSLRLPKINHELVKYQQSDECLEITATGAIFV